jgi:hypothetical protein
MIRKLLVVLTVVSALNLTVPTPILAQDLTGRYQCEGVGPNGTRYRGVVEIARNDQTYRLRWTIPPDGVYLGIGIISGDELAASYFGQVLGVVLYKIEKGPRLVGQWTVTGAEGQVYSETLTKLSMKVTTPAQPTNNPRAATLALNLLR